MSLSRTYSLFVNNEKQIVLQTQLQNSKCSKRKRISSVQQLKNSEHFTRSLSTYNLLQKLPLATSPFIGFYRIISELPLATSPFIGRLRLLRLCDFLFKPVFHVLANFYLNTYKLGGDILVIYSVSVQV